MDGVKRLIEIGMHRCGKVRRKTENGYSVVYCEEETDSPQNLNERIDASLCRCESWSLAQSVANLNIVEKNAVEIAKGEI
jgi:hypothetical protein